MTIQDVKDWIKNIEIVSADDEHERLGNEEE